MLKLSLFYAASVALLLAAHGAGTPAAAATPTGGNTTGASNPTGKQMAPSRRPRQQGH